MYFEDGWNIVGELLNINERSEKTWRTKYVNTQRRKNKREEGQVAVRLVLADRRRVLIDTPSPFL
jgi:hypothetical protein